MSAVLDVFFSILKANIIVLGIILVTFVIEQITPLSLFVDQFKWKKSPRNAEIHLNGDSGYYVLIILAVFIYDISMSNININFIAVISWLVIMIPLVRLFRKYYNKYQGFDPNKADDDFT